MTRFQINVASATLLLNAYMLHAKPVLNQRQGGIEWLDNRDFNDKFGWTVQQGEPVNPDDPENGWVSASDGSTWVAETMDRWGRDYLFLQDDASVANCLINLHFTQPDACISVKGSECETKAGTSRILNIRSYQLTSEDSFAMQAAVTAMVGSNVDASDPKGLTLKHVDYNDRTGNFSEDNYGANRPKEYGFARIFFGGADEEC